ncbi:MAG: cation-transporting P-type ATPase [Proteobacteria bacterium]|nr:cation-transporting P-type ATPase [Pseudomonadota bacterium]
MKINSLSRDQILQGLVTSENGLAEDEARRRLAEFGSNEITETRKRPLFLRFLNQLTHFLALLLWFAALLSFLSEYLLPGEGMLSLGIAITAVIFINAVFTFIQEYRAEKALEAMKKLLPFNVQVLRDGKQRDVAAGEIVPGDVVILAEGDKVPADLRLIEESDIRVNNSSLTGESESVPRTTAPCDGEIINSPNIVFAGTSVVSGSGKGIVFATGMRTEFGRIAQLTGTVTPDLSPLQKEIVKITRVVTAIAGVTGLFFFTIGFLIGRTFWDNFLFAIGIILANVPEGLLPTVTLSLAMGSQRMAKRNALIKTLTSVETLGSVTVICTDKTGTLTQNRMTVKKAVNIGGEATSGNKPFSPLAVAYLCNNTLEVDGKLKGEPTEAALYRAAVEAGGHIENTRIREFAFDSDRKRMSTLHRIKDKAYVMTKGAPESLLATCTRYLAEDGVRLLDDKIKEQAVTLYRSLMDEGLRVLAFGFREIGEDEQIEAKEDAEQGIVLTGLIGLADPPRPEVAEAIKKCREAGIRIIMITGDGSRTAVAIAREIGLVRAEPTVVEGTEFLRMTDAELHDVLSGEEVIFSRMTPKHKLRVVNVLKEKGERVAVTGDGVNDAPALKRADIGIAMGITGTDVAKEAADMVLLDDNFATIVNAVEEGRAIFENIRKFITYIFAHLTPEAIPYILFIVFRIPLPLTVMQILAIDLGTETIPALALGVEGPEAAIMKQPPRPLTKGLIDRSLLFRGYIFLGLIGSIGVLAAYFHVLYWGGWRWGVELPMDNPLARQASTATFLGIVVMQIGNVFACRTRTESVFKAGMFSNRLILWGILIELLLCLGIIYTPWGNRIFSTAPVGVDVWLLLLPFTIILFLAEELRKYFRRKRAAGA